MDYYAPTEPGTTLEIADGKFGLVKRFRDIDLTIRQKGDKIATPKSVCRTLRGICSRRKWEDNSVKFQRR